MREAATDFGLAYLHADGDAACELMTPGYREEVVATANRTFDRLADSESDTSQDLPDCAAAITLVASIGTGQVGPSDKPEPAQDAAASNIELLESGEGVKRIEMNGGHADVASIAGQDGSISFEHIDGEWLVAGASDG